MDGEEQLRNKVTSGFKGGPYFKKPAPTPKRPFVQPDATIAQKAHAKPTTMQPIKK